MHIQSEDGEFASTECALYLLVLEHRQPEAPCEHLGPCSELSRVSHARLPAIYLILGKQLAFAATHQHHRLSFPEHSLAQAVSVCTKHYPSEKCEYPLIGWLQM